MSRAKELVDAHFDNYVGPLLTAAGVEEKIVALCAFMYRSSGIHFYKHAQEDAVEAARGAFANAAAHKETPTELLSFALRALCHTRDYVEGAVELPAKEGWDWYDAGARIAAAIPDDKWAGEFRLRTETGNAAAHKAPSLCDSEVDEWADKDLCRRCHNGGCAQTGLKRDTTVCVQFAGTRP